jgi:hypothetical protein
MRSRHAMTMPVVVRPPPIWQLNTTGMARPCVCMRSAIRSMVAGEGAVPSVTGTRQ